MQVIPKPAPLSWQGVIVRFDRIERPEACEVLVRGRWTLIAVDEALALNPNRLKRCCECQGAVQLHAAEPGKRGAHFVHRHAHAGCSRGGSFGGTRTRHPKALT